MSNYPPIADHGLIGDLQTAALVTTDGTVDWFCCPRFDSPSIFASLLDEKKGGHFALHAVDDCVTKQMYLPDTAVLVTRFLSPKGVAEVMDFMPLEKPGIVTDHHRLARAVRGIRGELEFEADIQPRFDYGREAHKTQVKGTDAVFEAAIDAYEPVEQSLVREAYMVRTLDAAAECVAERASRDRAVTMRHVAYDDRIWVRVEGSARVSDLLVEKERECQAAYIAH